VRRVVVIAVVLAAGAAPASAADDRPQTVPALHSFTPSAGTFTLRADARVVGGGQDARTLAADLGALLGRRVRTAGRARPGDVVLRRAAPVLGAEGYDLRIGRVFTITAPRTAGLFYGGRTLLQLVRGGRPIPRGRVRDVPAYRERGLMVDCGRAFYPRSWWLERIRRLADLKLNLIHLHLSDDQGFRIAVPSHPEIVSREHLTTADIRALVAEARKRHVTLVPEIDMPGHLTAALAKHPELQLRNAFGQAQAGKLDVTLPAARKFAHELVADLLPLFPGPWWHLGNDEYLGILSTPIDYRLYPQLTGDSVPNFVKEIRAQVVAAGKRLRVWSDGLGDDPAWLPRDVAVEWWEELHSQSPERLLADGRDVLNVSWWPLYYVTGGPLQGHRASEREMYETWVPRRFEGPYSALLPVDLGTTVTRDPLGATLAVWNDDPSSPAARPAALAAGIAPRLAILAQQTWGSAKLVPGYAAFRGVVARVTGTR
jgi:hexosaminidase